MLRFSLVVKNTIFLYAKMFLTIIVNVFATRILLQGLGISDYGIYSVVGGAISMLGFLSASMSSTTQRYLNISEGTDDKQQSKKVFENALIIHKYLSLIVVSLLILAGIFFFCLVFNIPEGRLTATIIVYSSLIVSTAYSVTIAPYDGALNAHEDLHIYSIIGVVDCVFRFFIALSLLYISIDKLIVYGILMSIESWLIREVTKKYCCSNYEECKPTDSSSFDKKLVQDMISFAGWNLLNTASAMITLYSMNIIINHYYGTIYNAAMGVATQLTGVLMAFSLNMQKALTPAMMKQEGAHNREAVLNLTCSGSKFAFIIFAILGIPVYFSIDWILSLWLEEVPEYTSVFSRLLIISILLEQYFVFLAQTIMAQGRVKEYCITKSITNALPIFVSIVTCTMGCGASWVLINRILFFVIIGGIINIYYCRRNVGLSIKMYVQKTIVPTLIAAFIVLMLSSILYSNIHVQEPLGLAIVFLISIILYFVLSLKNDERKKIIKIFRRK